MRARKTQVGRLHHQFSHRGVQAELLQLRDVRRGRCGAIQPCGPVGQPGRRVAAGALGRLRRQLGPSARGQSQVGLVDAALEIVSPRQEAVDPNPHRVAVAVDRPGYEARAPAIVAERRHRLHVPLRLVVAAPQQLRPDRVVSIGETIGLDRDLVADDALGCEAPVVHARRHVLDHGAHAAIGLGRDRQVRRLSLRAARRLSHGRSSQLSSSTASGGSVNVIECRWPCAGAGLLATPPRLPAPLPP